MIAIPPVGSSAVNTTSLNGSLSPSSTSINGRETPLRGNSAAPSPVPPPRPAPRHQPPPTPPSSQPPFRYSNGENMGPSSPPMTITTSQMAVKPPALPPKPARTFKREPSAPVSSLTIYGSVTGAIRSELRTERCYSMQVTYNEFRSRTRSLVSRGSLQGLNRMQVGGHARTRRPRLDDFRVRRAWSLPRQYSEKTQLGWFLLSSSMGVVTLHLAERLLYPFYRTAIENKV